MKNLVEYPGSTIHTAVKYIHVSLCLSARTSMRVCGVCACLLYIGVNH